MCVALLLMSEVRLINRKFFKDWLIIGVGLRHRRRGATATFSPWCARIAVVRSRELNFC